MKHHNAHARTRRVALTLSLALAAAAVPARALAQQTDDPEALIREGVELRRRGNDQEALERFRRAFERAPTPRAEAQMALAEQALGRWLDADTHLRHALSSTNDPWIQGARATLETSLGVIGQHIGRFDVAGGVPGAEVWVNGRRSGTLPLAEPIRVTAGTVLVELRAPGYHSVQRSVVVPAGQLAREEFELVAVTSAAPATNGTASTGTTIANGSSSTTAGGASTGVTQGPSDAAPVQVARRPLHPAVFGVGVALTAVSGAMLIWSGIDTLAARDVYVMDPTEERFNDGVARQTRTNVLIATTGVLAAATLAIGLFATQWTAVPAQRTTATRTPRVFAAPVEGGGLAGIAGSF